MKLWLNLRDIFNFNDSSRNTWASPLSHSYKDSLIQRGTNSDSVAIQNIRFDNAIRLWISCITFAACVFMWVGHVIPFLWPIFYLLVSYGAIEITATLLLAKGRFVRPINYLLCGMDLVAMSIAVRFTGNVSSPLYFLYFIPLIIQAFHRDWTMLLFYGVGGTLGYATVIFFSLSTWTSVHILDLSARIFLMMLTVTISLLAVSILRRKEAYENRQLSRVKFLTYLSQRLNTLSVLSELPQMIQEIVQLLGLELNESVGGWARLFLAQANEPVMNAIDNPSDARSMLKQSISAHACPAFRDHASFQLNDAQKEEGCPTETFSFGSHLCTPVLGTHDEAYGVLLCASPKPHAFGPEEKQFLEFIARSVGLTVQRLKRVDEVHSAYEMGSFAMASFMKSIRTSAEAFDSIVEGFKKILTVDQVSIMLWDQEKRHLSTVKTSGPLSTNEMQMTFQLGQECREKYWNRNRRHGRMMMVRLLNQDWRECRLSHWSVCRCYR
jgi:putative methionine-R-sulfoxide reductase with GAF domain